MPRNCQTQSALFIAVLFFLNQAAEAAKARITGELKKWHPVTIHFSGPPSTEMASNPNPFLDYRLQVVFRGPNGKTFDVPGFFDGDGNGKGTGDVWSVKFVPDQVGRWSYQASFRKGPQVAVDLRSDAGMPTAFDGNQGTFEVAKQGAQAPGFFKWGLLEYVGKHYLKFREGPFWIKGGTDEPENLLAYRGFDDTKPSQAFARHVANWKPGDPDWNDGAGKGIIGSLNYLGSRHVNSIYFLTSNIGGDGKDVWPFAGAINPEGSPSNDNLHYDLSKLHQWEIVFAHAQRLGIHLQMVLNEAEERNKRELDDATLGPERKLFHRELAARFGHHLALTWNLCEEYELNLNFGPERIKEFAAYLQAVDPYDHPITVHNQSNSLDSWLPFVGDVRFSLTSFQYYPLSNKPPVSYGDKVETFRQRSQQAGRPIPIFMDEFYLARKIDDDQMHQAKWPYPSGQSYLRKHVLWPVLFSGGAGVEYILENNLNNDDFRPYEKLWDYTWYARKFMEEHLPFWEMAPKDELFSPAKSGAGKAEVFAKTGEVYAVYLPSAAAGGELNLEEVPGRFERRWYNPRTGAFEGAATTISGGLVLPLGDPPGTPDEDWVLLITREALR